jgi:hypothetical protein
MQVSNWDCIEVDCIVRPAGLSVIRRRYGMFRKLAFLMVILGVCTLGVMSVEANQYFSIHQAIQGTANNDWSFMTAWELSTGNVQVSASWYNGGFWFSWNQNYYYNWTALFMYDEGSGTTRELMWAYCQKYGGH